MPGIETDIDLDTVLGIEPRIVVDFATLVERSKVPGMVWVTVEARAANLLGIHPERVGGFVRDMPDELRHLCLPTSFENDLVVGRLRALVQDLEDHDFLAQDGALREVLGVEDQVIDDFDAMGERAKAGIRLLLRNGRPATTLALQEADFLEAPIGGVISVEEVLLHPGLGAADLFDELLLELAATQARNRVFLTALKVGKDVLETGGAKEWGMNVGETEDRGEEVTEIVERLALGHALVEANEVLEEIRPGWMVGGLFCLGEADERGPAVLVPLSGREAGDPSETDRIVTGMAEAFAAE